MPCRITSPIRAPTVTCFVTSTIFVRTQSRIQTPKRTWTLPTPRTIAPWLSFACTVTVAVRGSGCAMIGAGGRSVPRSWSRLGGLYLEISASSSGSNRTLAYSTAPGLASVAAATFWLARWRIPTSASLTGVSVCTPTSSTDTLPLAFVTAIDDVREPQSVVKLTVAPWTGSRVAVGDGDGDRGLAAEQGVDRRGLDADVPEQPVEVLPHRLDVELRALDGGLERIEPAVPPSRAGRPPRRG